MITNSSVAIYLHISNYFDIWLIRRNWRGIQHYSLLSWIGFDITAGKIWKQMPFSFKRYAWKLSLTTLKFMVLASASACFNMNDSSSTVQQNINFIKAEKLKLAKYCSDCITHVREDVIMKASGVEKVTATWCSFPIRYLNKNDF